MSTESMDVMFRNVPVLVGPAGMFVDGDKASIAELALFNLDAGVLAFLVLAAGTALLG